MGWQPLLSDRKARRRAFLEVRKERYGSCEPDQELMVEAPFEVRGDGARADAEGVPASLSLRDACLRGRHKLPNGVPAMEAPERSGL